MRVMETDLRKGKHLEMGLADVVDQEIRRIRTVLVAFCCRIADSKHHNCSTLVKLRGELRWWYEAKDGDE